MTRAPLLIACAAAIVLVLGLVHLAYTFHGPKLTPRAAGLQAAMEADSPHISRRTTMWGAWISFNASHSLGAILFGLLYGYLACALPQVLLGSPFLCAVGLGLLLAYVALGWCYWFSVPLTGVSIAALLFAGGLALQAWTPGV